MSYSKFKAESLIFLMLNFIFIKLDWKEKILKVRLVTYFVFFLCFEFILS